MKHFDFRKKTRALVDAGLNVTQPKEETNADEDHEVRPEDRNRQGARQEHRAEGQGEGSAREEGGAR